jgi:hypothetical protein
MNETAQMLATLSEWIDSSYPETMIGSELHIRRRIDKLMEESGEVGQAVGGWFGENPRKGITHTRTDVLGELLDVAVTALGAYESLTGNTGGSMDALEEKMRGLLKRVDLPTPEARPAEQDTETLPLDLEEWAEYFDHWGENVGSLQDADLTGQMVAKLLRRPKPFGAAANDRTEGGE